MRSPWEVYDRLLQEVPSGLAVTDCLIGIGWSLVTSAASGIAMTHRDQGGGSRLSFPLAGLPVRGLAEHIKSWNVFDASVGMAALNSCLNSQERLEVLLGMQLDAREPATVFDALYEEVKGKRVAVVGHFPDLEPLADACRLSILERNPQSGDYPDPACEYILAEQDYVFITGTSLTNKTLPRLLELSRDAFTVLVGPSVPLSPLWFEYGVDLLAGTVVVDPAGVRRVVQEAGHREIFDHGARMVHLRHDEIVAAASQRRTR
jgi:uncharacterized protein